MSELPDKVKHIDIVRIEYGRKKVCDCNSPHYEIDYANRLVLCADCGAVTDPFEALYRLALRYDQINNQLDMVRRQAEELRNYQPRRRVIKEFERFGLGKTIQELEWCRIVTGHQGGKALLVLPLGVRQEFTHDAQELLQITPPQYVRTMNEVKQAEGQLLMTNYERVRDGDIDPSYFTAACLDEASVSLKDAAAVKRESIAARVAKAEEIVKDSPQEHFILWHDLEAERHAIKKAMPEAVEIYGAQDLDERERNTIAFSKGKIQWGGRETL